MTSTAGCLIRRPRASKAGWRQSGSCENRICPSSCESTRLFPRDPLGGGKTMADFGLPDVQSMSDLEGLVAFGQEVGIKGIIYSVAKITRPQQGGLSPVMERMKRVYQHLSPGQRLVFRGGSWRLPENVAKEHVVDRSWSYATGIRFPPRRVRQT